MSQRIYLNGELVAPEQAKISVFDRGFLFADGVYEVIPVYGGRPFRLLHHLQRLDGSLAGIQLANPYPHAQWQQLLQQLIDEHGGGDQSIYLQVTRGPSMPRDHAFPTAPQPTVLAISQPLLPVPERLRQGIAAITAADIRWHWCHIKSIALLPNVLLRQQALDQQCSETLMLRDGWVTEGAATNIFCVHGREIATPPHSHLLLPGITRDLVVELCQQHDLTIHERPISEAALRSADEIWITSSTKEVLPVIALDGKPVGSALPGPMWHRIDHLYQHYKAALQRGDVEPISA